MIESVVIPGVPVKLILLIAVLAGFAALNGCASVKETYAADGRKAHALNCSGTARGWDKCLSAAGDLCRELGYDILDRSSEDAEFGSAGGSTRGFAATSVKTAERSMVIACKRPSR